MSSIVDNFDGTYTWYFSDGYNFTTSVLKGADGINGTNGIDGTNGTNGIDGINGTSVTISSVVDNFDGTYTWYFSDGYNFTTSNLKGTDGINGTNGINGLNGTDGINGTSVNLTQIINNGDGTYIWVFSNGLNYTTGNLTGAQGIQGVQGFAGLNGTNGLSTNVSVVNNGDGTYTWKFFYSNGTNYANFTTSNLTGAQGIQGIQGIQGVAGVNGTNGINGVNGTNGLNGTNGINGINGTNGINGLNGTNGVNGTSFNVTGGYFINNNNTISFNASFDYLNDSLSWYSILNPNGFQNETQINNSISSALATSSQNYIDQVLVAGTGYKSIKSADIKGAGQIVLVNGSGHLTGINTTFLGGGLDRLDNYFYFYVNGTKYFVFPINNNTDANLTATYFGNQTVWTGGNITTDLVLVVNTANNTFASATGYMTQATGQYSSASGFKSQALADNSFAVGYQNVANGSSAVAMGSSNVASGIQSTAFGFNNVASGNTALVWGQNNLASGTYATAFGYITQATSQSSTAFGERTVAEGKNCVAMGYYTNCTAYGDVVIGRYNVGGGTFNSWVATDPVFEVGVGSNATNRSNALTIYKNGTSVFTGSVVFSDGVSSSALDSKYVQNSVYWTNYSTGGSSTSATVFTLLSGLRTVLNNASVYVIKCDLLESSANSSTGVVLRVNTTGSPTTVRTVYTKMATTSAMETLEGTSTSTNTLSATGSSTTTSVALLDTYVVTGASPSTWTLEFRSEVAGSTATISAGSFCVINEVG
jgi:hypothetical protein